MSLPVSLGLELPEEARCVQVRGLSRQQGSGPAVVPGLGLTVEWICPKPLRHAVTQVPGGPAWGAGEAGPEVWGGAAPEGCSSAPESPSHRCRTGQAGGWQTNRFLSHMVIWVNDLLFI